jgi:hypothetical protein
MNTNFFVSIATIKKYKVALDMLLDSLPPEWKNKYILVYQDENMETHEENTKIFEDGHMEVYLPNNISDYGNWVGVNVLFEKKLIPADSWILFIHDTCKFINHECSALTRGLINNYDDSQTDILWLCDTGQCNICLIRKAGVEYGNKLYKDIKYMTKMETIKYEHQHRETLSPKSFPVNHSYVRIAPVFLGKRFVYNNQNQRCVLLYKSINLEKYYYHTVQESDHPFAP